MIPRIRKSKLNFCYSFYEDKSFNKYYTNLAAINKLNDEKATEVCLYDKNLIVSIYLIPQYLNIGANHLNSYFGVFCKSYQLGFAIDLTNFSSAKDYLKNQLSTKVFKNLRQDRQRLENNFDIQFQVYHLFIHKETYDELMNTLKEFITIRFKGKTSRHAALQRWNHYNETVLEQILDGTASLFVLKNQDKAIAISLNYHYKNVLYAAIISFDHNYHNYSLGRQMFYRQIEWCFNSGYRLIDLAWGSFDYKIKFSNAVFRYQTHVIYPKKNLAAKFLAFIQINKLCLIYYVVLLRDKKIKNPKLSYKDKWLQNNF